MSEQLRRPVAAIIQARMGSSRLPGKTLADIAGKPLLAHIIQRVLASQLVNKVVVATTSERDDAPILDLADKCGVIAYAGSRDDVLDRYYRAATLVGAEIIVRVTADDPFKEPVIIDEIVRHLLANQELDYASNTLEPTYPEGLDIEAFTFLALHRAWSEASLVSDREHVTPYIWRNPHMFRIESIRHSPDLSSLRWTVDYEQDLRFAREIYARLYRGQVFLMEDILSLLASEPWLSEINGGIVRNEGYLKSLEKERSGGPDSPGSK